MTPDADKTALKHVQAANRAEMRIREILVGADFKETLRKLSRRVYLHGRAAFMTRPDGSIEIVDPWEDPQP